MLRRLAIFPLAAVAVLLMPTALAVGPEDIGPTLLDAAARCPDRAPAERPVEAARSVGAPRTIGPVGTATVVLGPVPVPTVGPVTPPVEETPSVPTGLPPVGPVTPPQEVPSVPLEPVSVDPPVDQVGPFEVAGQSVGPVGTPALPVPWRPELDGFGGITPRHLCKEVARNAVDRLGTIDWG